MASGAAGLVYQVVWMRRLTLAVGASAAASAATLAGFLGGLSLGAACAARLVTRVRRPLLAYGILEVAIAAYAATVPVGKGPAAAALAVAGVLGPAAAASQAATAVGFGVAALTVAPAALLMGATLPLLVRALAGRGVGLGASIGALYAANTAGAVAGCLLAAFVWIPGLGSTSTLRWTAAANLAVGLAAIAASRALDPVATASAGTVPAASGPARPATGRRMLAASLLAGAAVLALEVVWTRLLEHLLGSSLHAFATMLAIFLAGLAVGGALVPLAVRRVSPAILFAVAGLGAGVATVVGARVLDGLAPRLPAAAIGPASSAWWCAAVMLPGTVVLGLLFPSAVLAVAEVTGEGGDRATARTWAWNALGAVAGPAAVAFVLLPRLGFAASFATCGLVLAGAAALAGGKALWRGPLALLAAVAVAGIGWSGTGAELHGIVRRDLLGSRELPAELAFYRAGRTSTVVLEATLGTYRLKTNGLIEGTIEPSSYPPARQLVPRWLARLPLALRPRPARVLAVGLGAGTFLEALPANAREVTVLELEAEVVAANRSVAASRATDPLADPRVRVTVQDARLALARGKESFDIVLSQPSHPWTAGSAHLYTHEFFTAVADRLSADGLFAQWIGLPFVDESLLRTILATATAVFDEVHLFRPPAGAGLILVASRSPVDVLARAAAFEPPPGSWAVGLERGEDLLAAWVADTRGVRRVAAGAALNTDDRNLLEARSPQVGADALARDGAEAFLLDLDPLQPPLPPGVEPLILLDRHLASGHWQRAALLLPFLDGLEALAARARLDAARGRPGDRGRLLAALESPADGSSRARRVLLALLPPGSGARPLDDGEQSFLTARDAARRGDWAVVAAAEESLSRLPPDDPLFPQATRLRIGWRLAAGDRERADEALRLLDRLLVRNTTPLDLFQRADAARVAGRVEVALASASMLATGPGLAPPQRLQLRRFVEALPVDARTALWRAQLLTVLADGP